MDKKEKDPQLLIVEDEEDLQQLKKEAREERARRHEGRTNEVPLVEKEILKEVEDTEWEDEAQKIRRVPIGWIFLALIAIVIAAVTSLGLIQRKAAADARATGDGEEHSVTQATAEVDALEVIVKGFFAAKTVEGKLKYVRDPKRVAPFMHDWYGRHGLEPLEISFISSMKPFYLKGREFWVLRATGEEQSFPLMIEKLGDKDFKIDWETHSAYNPIDWEEYIESKSKEETRFRVYVERDFYFLYEFEDENRWDCYKLTTSKSDQHLYGFVDKSSYVGKEMRTAVRSGRVTPLVIDLQFPPNITKLDNAVYIKNLFAKTWFIAQ